ncbi:hypothetical protein B296_00032134 [Ensete ventricosum]|uniref:Uncharacterized protein n=1 Tax=Ensete ventricosum TaxID=4639 RepID=A0A427A1I0_ENSVE|nr:hypothetical protein B296_00032134 [Ensete ventricosum]
MVRLHGCRWSWLQRGYDCNGVKTGQRSAQLLQRRTVVVWSERPLLAVFTLMLAAIKAVGSERLLQFWLRFGGVLGLRWKWMKVKEGGFRSGVHGNREDEDNEPSEERLKPKDEAMEEEPQLADYAVHALADYSNP